METSTHSPGYSPPIHVSLADLLQQLVQRAIIAGWLLAVAGCGETDPHFISPAATFETYQRALASRDMELLWACYSETFKAGLPEGHQGWAREWMQKTDAQLAAEQRRQIADERLINERIGYLLFDPTTLESKQASPFFYFIREKGDWKLTTHLDSVFHRELERAIERGEFELSTD
jgi:hypothetical protein